MLLLDVVVIALMLYADIIVFHSDTMPHQCYKPNWIATTKIICVRPVFNGTLSSYFKESKMNISNPNLTWLWCSSNSFGVICSNETAPPITYNPLDPSTRAVIGRPTMNYTGNFIFP